MNEVEEAQGLESELVSQLVSGVEGDNHVFIEGWAEVIVDKRVSIVGEVIECVVSQSWARDDDLLLDDNWVIVCAEFFGEGKFVDA